MSDKTLQEDIAELREKADLYLEALGHLSEKAALCEHAKKVYLNAQMDVWIEQIFMQKHGIGRKRLITSIKL